MPGLPFILANHVVTRDPADMHDVPHGSLIFMNTNVIIIMLVGLIKTG